MKTKLMLILLLGVLLGREAQAFYNPSTGRWISRDPIGEVGGNNLYAFVRNLPTSRVDYLGQMTVKRCEDMIANAIESARVAALMSILDENKCPAQKLPVLAVLHIHSAHLGHIGTSKIIRFTFA